MKLEPFRALGSGVSIAFDDAAIGRTLRDLTATFAPSPNVIHLRYRLESTSGPLCSLWRNDRVIHTTPHAADLAPVFELDLYRQVLDGTRGWALHAAALSRDGSGMVLIGSSGAGKSTLARALVDRGASYVTDEVALVTPDGGLRGITRPITFDEEAFDGAVPAGFTRWRHEVRSSTGPPHGIVLLHPPPARLAHEPSRLDALVALSFRPDRPTVLSKLSAGEALTRMWDGTLNPGGAAFECAVRQVNGRPAYQLCARDVGEACAELEAVWPS